MRHLSSVQIASLLLVAGAAYLGAMTVGCDDSDPDHHVDNGGPPADQTITTTPEKAAIDTGATINVSAGAGVGVFVQYATGGQWTITTACDTNSSGFGCNFDLFVSGVDPSTTINNPQGQSLSGADTVDLQADGSVHLGTNTSTGLDGLTFTTTPGATIELETFLDGVPQPRFVYWVGDRVLHEGAPTDPIDLAPSAM
jgi:hypothetical protein